jgi:NADH:ubiquinone oxidoreductase subunit E
MITINVCIGSACHLKGSQAVIKGFQRLIEEMKLDEKIELKAAFCLGKCTKAVSVKVDDEDIVSVNENNVEDFFKENVLGRMKD